MNHMYSSIRDLNDTKKKHNNPMRNFLAILYQLVCDNFFPICCKKKHDEHIQFNIN